MGVSLITAAKNRLSEEMGFTCHLQKLFDFIYKTEFSNGLIEHELDHVFLGFYESDPQPDKNEVNDWSWRNIHDLKEEIIRQPEMYTYWFRYIYERFYWNIVKGNLKQGPNLGEGVRRTRGDKKG